MSRRPDAIVIGSGIGGLAAALALARKGRSVCLLEALPELGGLIKPHVAGGHELDVGLQYVGQAGPGQAFPRALEELGVDVTFRALPAGCLERHVFPGFEMRLVAGPEAQLELLLASFPREERGLRWFFDALAAFELVQSLATRGGRKVSRGALRGLGALAGATRLDFATWLRRRIRDPQLVTALGCFAGDMALPPSRASTFSSLLDWIHFLRGAWYPVGGGGALRDAFVRALVERGAELRTGAEVTGIAPGFAVTLAGGETVHARAVVSSADATMTLGWLGRPRAARPSLSAYGAFLGAEGDPGPLTAANLWVYEADDLEAVYRPLLDGREGDRLGVFMASSTLKDPGRGRAPAGQHGLLAMAFAPAASEPGPAPRAWSEEETRRRVERVLAVVRRTLPGLRVVWTEDITPATFWHKARARLGGLYGPEMSVAQSVPRRFLPVTRLRGLYLAGASVFGGGVLPSLLSGRIAAALADRHLR